jgi:hypothetical protein
MLTLVALLLTWLLVSSPGQALRTRAAAARGARPSTTGLPARVRRCRVGSTASTRTSVTFARRLPASRSSASDASPAPTTAEWKHSLQGVVAEAHQGSAQADIPTKRTATTACVLALLHDVAPSTPCVDISTLRDRSTKCRSRQPASGCAPCTEKQVQLECGNQDDAHIQQLWLVRWSTGLPHPRAHASMGKPGNSGLQLAPGTRPAAASE